MLRSNCSGRHRIGTHGGQLAACATALAVCGLLILLAACGNGEPESLAAIRQLHEQGRYEESLELLEEFREVHPDDPEAQHLYGVAVSATGNASLAIWPLRKAAEHPDWAAKSGTLLAMLLLQTGDAPDAVEAASRVLADEPDHLEALGLRAQARLAAKGDAEEALADIDRILELDPDNLTALVPRAMALIALKRLEEAEVALETLDSRWREDFADPSDQAKWCATLAIFAREKGDLELAKQRFANCLEKFPKESVLLAEAVGFYDQTGEPERGTEILRRALQDQPRPLDTQIILARRLREFGETEEAERLLREAVEDESVPIALLARLALVDHFEALENYAAAASALEPALEVQDDPRLRFRYTDLLIRAKEYDRALQVAEGLEEQVFVDLARGVILLGQGKPREALETLEAGLRLWPNNAGARYYAALAAEELGDFDRAISEYRDSIRANAAASDAGLRLARLYDAEGNYESGWIAVRHHLSPGHPRDAEALVLSIRLAHRLGGASGVREALGQLARLPGQAGRAVAEAARIAREEGGAGEAVTAVERAGLDLTDPRHAEALSSLVASLSEAGDHQAALARVGAALEAHPDAAAFYEVRARALEASGAEREAVRASFERAIELDPDDARALAGLGRIAAENGELEDAVALYDRAAVADPDDADIPYAVIELLAARGRSEEVGPRLEAMLKSHPYHGRAADRLARHLVVRGESLDRALKLARRALRFQAGSEALDTLGWVRLERGDFEASIKAFERALELRPDAPSTLYRFGRALAAAGQARAAQDALHRALEAGSFPEREQALADLARLDAGSEAAR
jgi:tetratricopeptide (TPR) repeat protein